MLADVCWASRLVPSLVFVGVFSLKRGETNVQYPISCIHFRLFFSPPTLKQRRWRWSVNRSGLYFLTQTGYVHQQCKLFTCFIYVCLIVPSNIHSQYKASLIPPCFHLPSAYFYTHLPKPQNTHRLWLERNTIIPVSGSGFSTHLFLPLIVFIQAKSWKRSTVAFFLFLYQEQGAPSCT